MDLRQPYCARGEAENLIKLHKTASHRTSCRSALANQSVVETARRIRLAFAAACSEADLIRSLPGAALPLGP